MTLPSHGSTRPMQQVERPIKLIRLTAIRPDGDASPERCLYECPISAGRFSACGARAESGPKCAAIRDGITTAEIAVEISQLQWPRQAIGSMPSILNHARYYHPHPRMTPPADARLAAASSYNISPTRGTSSLAAFLHPPSHLAEHRTRPFVHDAGATGLPLPIIMASWCHHHCQEK